MPSVVSGAVASGAAAGMVRKSTAALGTGAAVWYWCSGEQEEQLAVEVGQLLLG
jgi:hypothetical protein